MEKELSSRSKTIITVFMLVVLGCMIGWVYEMLFYRIDMGHFIKRGQGFGPWLPIYGFGGLALTLVTYKRKINPWIIFVGTIIGAGILEFATGYFCYHYMDGLRLWDYNTEIWNWGNIGGYICFRSVVLFGFAGLVVIYSVAPTVKKIIDTKFSKVSLILAYALAGLFVLDIIVWHFVRG